MKIDAITRLIAIPTPFLFNFVRFNFLAITSIKWKIYTFLRYMYRKHQLIYLLLLNKCHLFSKGKLIKCCLTVDWYLIIHSNEWLCTYMTQGRLFKIKKLRRADSNLNLSKIKLFLPPFLFYFLYKNKCVLMEFKCPWWLRALVNFSWILIFRLIVRGNQRKHFNWFNLRLRTFLILVL